MEVPQLIVSPSMSSPHKPHSYFYQTQATEHSRVSFGDRHISPESYLEIPGDVNMPSIGIASHRSMTHSRFDIHLPVHRDGITYVHLEQENYQRMTDYIPQRISFTRNEHNREGYSISDTLTGGRPLIPLRGGDDIVLHEGDPINIRIMWPGYHSMNDHYTFSVETNKARITREALLIKVAQGLNNFFQEIRNSWPTMRPPVRGSERFTISNAQSWQHEQGLSADDVLIMGLNYRGGWDYQPDLYVRMQNFPENKTSCVNGWL